VRGITTAATIWIGGRHRYGGWSRVVRVGVLGAIFVFMVLEARPLTRRIDGFLRRVGGEPREDQDENSEQSDQMEPLPEPGDGAEMTPAEGRLR
jgi:hypothetical protein